LVCELVKGKEEEVEEEESREEKEGSASFACSCSPVLLAADPPGDRVSEGAGERRARRGEL